MKIKFLLGVFLLLSCGVSQAGEANSWRYLGEFKATAYCSCSKCCGKSDGITASGKQASKGTIACNWLPFGSKLSINGKLYTVQDRGAKSIFGSKKNHIKALDIWFPTHQEALNYGRRQIKVWQLT